MIGDWAKNLSFTIKEVKAILDNLKPKEIVKKKAAVKKEAGGRKVKVDRESASGSGQNASKGDATKEHNIHQDLTFIGASELVETESISNKSNLTQSLETFPPTTVTGWCGSFTTQMAPSAASSSLIMSP